MLRFSLSVYLLWWALRAAGVLGHPYDEPQVGDVLFQSLPRSDLVDAIEGITDSPFSHCGIVVATTDGAFGVLESLGVVHVTALDDWLTRGRGDAFSVYRLREPYRDDINALVDAAFTYAGRPYDYRYAPDDEAIYCSELVDKAFRAVHGEGLGQREVLGDLNWKPYERTIRKYEGAAPPLERELISPRGMSEAPQLELVLAHGW